MRKKNKARLVLEVNRKEKSKRERETDCTKDTDVAGRRRRRRGDEKGKPPYMEAGHEVMIKDTGPTTAISSQLISLTVAPSSGCSPFRDLHHRRSSDVQ